MAEGERFSFQSVRQQSEVIWKDHYCGKVLRITLLMVVMAAGLLFWWLRYLPPQVPLFYSRPWGEPQLGSPWSLFYLPSLGLLILLLNMLIGGLIFGFDKLLARMLLTAAALSGFLTTFALVRILWLV